MKTNLGRTECAILQNKSGGSLAKGDVGVISTADPSAATTTTTSGYSSGKIVVVLEPNGIASNGYGLFATAGYVDKINLNTAATVGQLIKTHTVAKQGTPHSAPVVTGSFAQALTASATPEAILFGFPTVTPVGGAAIPEDGWTAVSETWTRTGNHTFTVTGDLTAKYRKGAKVKYNDGALDYGVVISSSYSAPNTTITLATNSDYAMAAGSITGTYISYVENPEGFPHWFNYSPTTACNGSMTYTSVTITRARFNIQGKVVTFVFSITGTTGGSAATAIFVSTPTLIANKTDSVAIPVLIVDGGGSIIGRGFTNDNGGTDVITVGKYDATNWGLGSGRVVKATAVYEMG